MATHSSSLQNPVTLTLCVNRPERSWQEIVEAASRERDPENIKLLSEELERVLEQRAEKLRARSATADEANPKSA